MNKFHVSVIGAALALTFSAGAIAAMSKSDYRAASDAIAADYRSARDACKSQAGNAKDICMAEAKGRQQVATAELKARNAPNRENRRAVLVAKADSDYAVAKEKCDDQARGNRKACMRTALADRDSARADASRSSRSSSASTSRQETPGEYVDDTAITAKVKAALLDQLSTKSSDINVETSKGRVQLSGFVRSRADIGRAVQIARGVKGVKVVMNDMILKGTQ